MTNNEIILRLIYRAEETITKKILQDYFSPDLDRSLFNLKTMCIDLMELYL